MEKYEEVKAKFGDAKVNQTKATALFAKSSNKENTAPKEPKSDITLRKTLKPNES